MSAGDEPQRGRSQLLSALNETARRFHEVRESNGLQPAPGSKAAEAIAQQGSMAGLWGRLPTQDALGQADLRLVAGMDHLGALHQLISQGEAVFALASLARSVMECSARAWWLLDPAIDGHTRILRGLVDRSSGLLGMAQIPEPPIQARAQALLELIERGAEEHGLKLEIDRRARRVTLGEVAMPGYLSLIRAQLDDMGEMAWRDLAAVAHAELPALISRLQFLPDNPPQEATSGTVLVAANPSMAQLTTRVGIALHSYIEAAGRSIELMGWSMMEWRAFRVEAQRLLVSILP